MQISEFENHRTALINKLLEKLKNLKEEYIIFRAHISSKYYDFTQAENDVLIVKNITLSQIKDFYKSKMLGSSDVRSKFSVHMKRQKPPREYISDDMEAMKEVYDNSTVVKDMESLAKLKKGLPLCGLKEQVPIDIYLIK